MRSVEQDVGAERLPSQPMLELSAAVEVETHAVESLQIELVDPELRHTEDWTARGACGHRCWDFQFGHHGEGGKTRCVIVEQDAKRRVETSAVMHGRPN